jgi:cation diffusion facilitator family transporter
MVLNQVDSLIHEHVYLGEHHDENARKTWWVVGLTAVMMVGEIIAGTVFNSMALLADGFHMATHTAALTVAAGAYAYAKRHARNRRFSFGTGKVGDLAGFASALILGVIALGIGFESITRLLEPRPVAFMEATFVAVIGLMVNVVSAALLTGHHHEDTDHAHDADQGHRPRHHDNNLRAAFVHVMADALTSVLAITALLGGSYLGWVWLDPVMGIVGGVVIGAWSWSLMRSTAAVLLDSSDAHLEAEIRQSVESQGDARITDLHVWRIGPGANAAIVTVAGTVDGEMVRSRLAPVHELAHVTVETH